MNVTKAVILAGGNNKALNVFENIKPLIKVAGKPLLVWTIERLEKAGVKEITVVTDVDTSMLHHEVLHYAKSKVHITYVGQQKTKSMVDTFRSVSDQIDGPCLVTMCDLIFEGDVLNVFLKGIKKTDNVALLISTDEENNRESGATGKIFYSQDRKLVLPYNDIPCLNAVEGGFYYFSKKGLKQFQTFVKKQAELKNYSEALTKFSNQTPVRLIDMGKRKWFDINLPTTLIRAELFLRNGTKDEKNIQTPKHPKTKRLPSPKRYHYNKSIDFNVYLKRGLLKNIEDYEIIPYEAYYSPHFVIVDKNIDKLYGEPVCKKLRQKGYSIHKILVDSGEWSKGVDTYLALVNQILTTGIDKKSTIISIGGGVVKDLSGFIASTLYRGIGFISIPTTVLAQCDAAITFKQGINGEGGKNLIGSHHAPLHVVVDPDVLKTLDRRYVADGLAECIKQASAQDAAFFEFFERYNGDIQNIKFLEDTLEKSIKLKIDSFQKDYYEEKEALVNQYGHEVGHAVEYLSGFTLGHGESVAIGMRVSAELSNILGIMDTKTKDRHIALLQKFELPVHIPKNIKPNDIVALLKYHKKSHSNEIRMVLVRDTGKIWHEDTVYTRACNVDLLKTALMQAYEKK